MIEMSCLFFFLNEKELHFGKREFSIVSDIKFEKKTDFFYSKVQNNLMNEYYFGLNKDKRLIFYSYFVDRKFVIKEEALYKIGMLYFIIKFLKFDLSRNFIMKFYFDLVESGEYLNYNLGKECFKVLHKFCSHDLKKI